MRTKGERVASKGWMLTMERLPTTNPMFLVIWDKFLPYEIVDTYLSP